MSDALLANTGREEALSRVYLYSVAAGAGYAVAVMDFDRDGVDAQIKAGGNMRPCLDVQLKATVNLGEQVDGSFRFPLKRRNYDLLRVLTMVPRILVVLDLPRDESMWLSITAEELILRRCAFWASLAGLPDTGNKESVTVSIQANNLFDVGGLKALMEQSRTGVIT